jgi:5'-nucleotidase
MNKRPTILLTNDDGVNSVGLWAAYDALASFADVVVAAPAVQQSAVGRSISIFEPLRMNEVLIHGHTAHVVEGRPTDSLLLGLYALKCQPDLVVSGINLGENITCESVTTSGTVGAAMEAANQGVPAIAFSFQMIDEGDKFSDPRGPKLDFSAARTVVRDVVQLFLKKGFPRGAHLLNVNIPHGDVRGYRVTTLGSRLFNTSVEMRTDPRGKPYYWICGEPIYIVEKNSDVTALRNGYVTVTPLTLDTTAYAACGSLTEIMSDLPGIEK